MDRAPTKTSLGLGGMRDGMVGDDWAGSRFSGRVVA